MHLGPNVQTNFVGYKREFVITVIVLTEFGMSTLHNHQT